MRPGSAGWIVRRYATGCIGSTRPAAMVLWINGRRDQRPGCRMSSRPNWPHFRARHRAHARGEQWRRAWVSAARRSCRAELAPVRRDDDEGLELLLFPAPMAASQSPRRPVPDWTYVEKELRRRGVTRVLLWEEYRAAVNAARIFPKSAEVKFPSFAAQAVAEGGVHFSAAGRAVVMVR